MFVAHYKVNIFSQMLPTAKNVIAINIFQIKIYHLSFVIWLSLTNAEEMS